MTDYISRDELRKHLADCMTAEFFDSDMKKAVVGIDVYVENMPSADVQPVKHGEWKINSDGYYPYCSVCGTVADQLTKHLTKYCPNCGARMDGDKGNNVRNLTDEETEIYESWIDHEAKDTGVNLMDGDAE